MISKNTRDRLAENGRIRVTLSPYTFVRTTVMTSKLLTEQDYRKLLKLELPEIVQFLEESTYKKEIDELASTESGLQLIEHSVQRNFWRAVDKLRRIADDDMRFFIDVYVWRNDIENIKTLIRGKRANEDVTRLRNLFLPGTITKDELMDLYAKPDVTALLNALELPFIDNPTAIYTERGLAGLEAAMTHGYYCLTHRIARRIYDERDLFRQYVLLEVDLMNILTILKLKRTGSPASAIEPYLVDAYAEMNPSEYTIRHRARKVFFKQLANANDIDETIRLLESSRFNNAVKPGIAAYRNTGSLLELEREFQIMLLRKATKLTHQKPLSADVVISYMLAKVIEARNIMVLIKGKELGVSEQFLEQELVVRT